MSSQSAEIYGRPGHFDSFIIFIFPHQTQTSTGVMGADLHQMIPSTLAICLKGKSTTFILLLIYRAFILKRCEFGSEDCVGYLTDL